MPVRNQSHSIQWTVADKVPELSKRTGPQGREVRSFSVEAMGKSIRIVEFQ